ncbi:hypothetical protein D3C85_1708780 [compost metagenome]
MDENHIVDAIFSRGADSHFLPIQAAANENSDSFEIDLPGLPDLNDMVAGFVLDYR